MIDNKSTSILQPLHFSLTFDKESIVKDIKCVLCEKIFKFFIEKDLYLAHLYLNHRLVIGDVDDVAILDEYLIYWRLEFQDHPLEEFCTTMLLDQLPDGTPSKDEKYYLLSDVLPKDVELRKRLHTKRLRSILEQHKYERTDQTFSRECLYCRDVIEPTRSEYIQHLFNKHFLQLGKSENLVFVDELLNNVQKKLDNLCCIFCEKIFKDRPTLKEHMRKKGHKRINPDNKKYDKYFLINYKLERSMPWNNTASSNNNRKKAYTNHNDMNRKQEAKPLITSSSPQQQGNNYRDVSIERGHSNDRVFQTNNSDSDWSDWKDEKQKLICLFCAASEVDFTKIKNHMINIHAFNLDAIIDKLSFYERVKIVNFIRRQMHILCCIFCNNQFATTDALLNHIKEENHLTIDDRKLWDQPEFFFPTYEDDMFLCYLEDTNDGNDNSIVVVPEDSKTSINLAAEELSKEYLIDE